MNTTSAEDVLDALGAGDALNALSAEELRSVIREIIPEIDDATHARLTNLLIDRAARGGSGWIPRGPSEATVERIRAFAKAAKREGSASPSEVDGYLRQGTNAFLRKDYSVALQIFASLLVPIGNGEVDLGQNELVDEVLGVDVHACVAQYVVSTYMTAAPPDRAVAVLSAMQDMRPVSCLWEPLNAMERVAIEPLPDFGHFLGQWRPLVEQLETTAPRSGWGSDASRWLREAVLRIDGTQGLANVARRTRQHCDLDAWCDALVEARDWRAALSAYEEALELLPGPDSSVESGSWFRGEFLDGAALATQVLQLDSLPEKLERAWREVPSMVRLRRWLGSSSNKALLCERVAEALAVCPKRCRRQLALLNVLAGDLAQSARLLADSPGLGWSDEEHPGYLVFQTFASLLGDVEPLDEPPDLYELGFLADPDKPSLVTPEVSVLLELAGVTAWGDETSREEMVDAMRKAAEKRISAVIEDKRRSRYEHAASLALACVRVDGSAKTTKWMADLRLKYRRYPALQRAFDRVKD